MASEEWLRHFMPLIGPTQKHGPVTPIQIADREERLVVLEGQRRADAGARRVLPREREARPPERRAGRRRQADGERARSWIAARTCSPSAARGATRRRPRRCRTRWPAAPAPAAATGRGVSRVLEQVLEAHEDAGVQGRHEGDRPGGRLPAGQLPVERAPHPGDAARDERVQPARHQRAEGQHLGQLLVQSYKELPSVGTITVYSPVDGKEIRFDDARRRPRLHAAGLADQPVVDGAVPAEQLRRYLQRRAIGRGAPRVVR